jgi:hypothetical protein
MFLFLNYVKEFFFAFWEKAYKFVFFAARTNDFLIVIVTKCNQNIIITKDLPLKNSELQVTHNIHAIILTVSSKKIQP